MNNIVLLGRLARDPEIKYTQSGKVVCQFTIAVNRPYMSDEGNQDADFIPVVFWGKQAEIVGNNFSKGQRILIGGRLQIRQYTAKDGSKRYATEVIANSFDFIEKKENGDSKPKQGAQGMQNFGEEVPFDENMPF